MGALLQVENLSVALPTRSGYHKAVDGISFAVDAGEVMGIAGESGSGKTITALSLFGLLPAGARTSGSIRLDGTELLELSSKQLRAIRGRQIAMVSQDPSTALHPILSIGTQITEHMRHHLGVSKSEALSRAADLLAIVRIPDPEQALRSYPGQFSGGMRQRIAIAVALAAEPRLLVADEPTTALDVTVQAGILRLLDRLCRERGLAVIIITHDLGVMSATARRALRHVRRAARRSGANVGAARQPEAPLHQRAARRAAAPGGRRCAAGPYWRQPAVARAGARRVPLPSALPVRAALMRDGQARAVAGR